MFETFFIKSEVLSRYTLTKCTKLGDYSPFIPPSRGKLLKGVRPRDFSNLLENNLASSRLVPTCACLTLGEAHGLVRRVADHWLRGARAPQ